MTYQSQLSGGLSRRQILLIGTGTAAAIAAASFTLSRRDRFDGTEMSPPEVLEAVRAGQLMLIDIRRPDEWNRTGIAEGARKLDMRRNDFIAALTDLAGGDPTRPIALICARGVRSDRSSARLLEAGFRNIIDVPEGMLGSSAGPGWLKRDLPLERP